MDQSTQSNDLEAIWTSHRKSTPVPIYDAFMIYTAMFGLCVLGLPVLLLLHG
jgi:hypothetical protein